MTIFREIADNIDKTIKDLYRKCEINELKKYVQSIDKLALAYMNSESSDIIVKIGLCPHCLSSFNTGVECLDCGGKM